MHAARPPRSARPLVAPRRPPPAWSWTDRALGILLAFGALLPLTTYMLYATVATLSVAMVAITVFVLATAVAMALGSVPLLAALAATAAAALAVVATAAMVSAWAQSVRGAAMAACTLASTLITPRHAKPL